MWARTTLHMSTQKDVEETSYYKKNVKETNKNKM